MRSRDHYPQIIHSLKAEIMQLKTQLRRKATEAPQPGLVLSQTQLVNSLKTRLNALRAASSTGQSLQGLPYTQVAALAATRLKSEIETLQAQKQRPSLNHSSQNEVSVASAYRNLQTLREEVREVEAKVAGLQGRSQHMEAVIALTERLQQEKDRLETQVKATDRLLKTRERQCLSVEKACEQLKVPPKPPRVPLGQASSNKTVPKAHSWHSLSQPVGLATSIVLLNRGAYLSPQPSP